ncbi:membrane protein [Marinobacterium lacunae]|uniref:Probable membrane transporter protein n=1 Tax=Marinobacterium lacunae TaxID=1232683 RepID=A0A081G3W6_9GAMM|nr:sulfite exporter TauE/SafE family protein [Marinobacterium lacunae]KEA65471.1 membrane protein [Marinobacterium lacunae]MBR9883653.1 sulfite exporter TauE/SafE family protein [Oceanospirillales bacterium]
MITDPLFYAAAIPAILIVGISKGGFGGGLGMLAVPLMSLVISPAQAAAIMLPILCLMDLVGLWSFRGKGFSPLLKTLIPAALIGIIIGALTFRYLSDQHLKFIVGAIAVLFTLNYWLRPGSKEPKQPSIPRGGFWGLITGFTSFSVHAGGPPLNIYLLPLRLEKGLYIGTTIIMFAAINYMKLIPYSMLGQFDTANLSTSAVLALLAPVGVRLGYWMHHRISEAWFYRICFVLLFATGSKLLFDAFTG